MRFFQKPWFRRFAANENITEEALKKIVENLDTGRFDASLGGYVYKQRLARRGQGKSGGYRVLLFYKQGDRVFFVYAFPKSQRANITQREKGVLKAEAAILMGLTEVELNTLVSQGEFYEFK
jgi:hypothetical protein